MANMFRTLVAAIALGTAATGTGSPALADAVLDCARGRDAAARLKACGEVIKGSQFATEQKASAYRTRGLQRSNAGALDQAIADFSEAIKLEPANASGYAGRAQARLTAGDLTGAIADYDAALKIAPQTATSAQYLNGRGHAHLVNGKTELALADFNEAVRLNPKSVTALNNRALAHRKKGDLALAVADYTAAIAINPIYALAYNNRGYVLEQMGRKSEAADDYRKALLIDRSLVGASEGLGRLKAMGGLAQESRKLVTEGKALVEEHCARCHAVGKTGFSPKIGAPEFRAIARRHPIQALREPLARGIAAPHDEMPKFTLGDTDIDRIVAYINSL
ncbi:MAG TPA: tetratricopeptide repeat protein [Hyphomicrobiaceae bacterium]|nr:tetratricopeptide repeat protein [Hyphomicrobiaceae bacterium]